MCLSDIAQTAEDKIYFYGSGSPCVKISAKTGEGVDDLLLAVQNALPQTRKRVKLLIPFDKGAVAAKIRQDGVIHSEEYTENGLVIEATAEISYLDTIKDYII